MQCFKYDDLYNLLIVHRALFIASILMSNEFDRASG